MWLCSWDDTHVCAFIRSFIRSASVAVRGRPVRSWSTDAVHSVWTRARDDSDSGSDDRE
jgi:hypothetical protein